MKKWKWLLAAAAALVLTGFWPVQGQDVATLQPVQILVCQWEADAVAVSGGEGLQGRGADLESAMADLCAGADGTAFLDTASVIVASGELDRAWQQLAASEALRPAAQVYAARRAPEPEAAGAYLQSRKDGLSISDLRAALAAGQTPQVPQLIESEGGFRIAASIGNAAR